jgi:hypothetical protein
MMWWYEITSALSCQVPAVYRQVATVNGQQLHRCALVVIEPDSVPHVPTLETRRAVVRAVACSVSEGGIAFLLQVDLLTLHRHYRDELLHGLDYYKAQVGGQLLDSAERGDVNAQRFWLERMGGWAPPEKATQVGSEQVKVQQAERKRLMDSIVNAIKPKIDPAPQGAKQRTVGKTSEARTARDLPPNNSTSLQ